MRSRKIISEKKFKELKSRGFIPDYDIDMRKTKSEIDYIRSSLFFDNVVDFSCMEIGDKGVVDLANALKNNVEIRTVCLAGNRIGNEGIEALVSMIRVNTYVEAIDLDANFFDNVGAEKLYEAFNASQTLKHVKLDFNNKVSKDLRDNFKELNSVRMPKLECKENDRSNETQIVSFNYTNSQDHRLVRFSGFSSGQDTQR